jgi:hypothetical protein
MTNTLVKKALRELKNEVRFAALRHSLLEASIAFLITLAMLDLLALKWYWAALVSSPLMIYAFRRNFKKANLYFVEQKIPQLKDQLLTVNDTANKMNEVIAALHHETLMQLKRVHNSIFVRFGGLTFKISILICLSFLIVGFSAFNVKLIEFEDLVGKMQQLGEFGIYDLNASLLDYEENTSEDIYGDKSIAELGYEELQLQINPIKSEVDIRDIQDAEKREFAKERRAQEIIATNDIAYEENIPKEYRKIVKFYFNEITKN